MSGESNHHPAQVFVWWITGIGLICAGVWAVYTYVFPKPTENDQPIVESVVEPEMFNFIDQTKVEYKLPPNGYSSVVNITANFEAYANDDSNPNADSISEKAMFKGVIVVNGEFCSKTQTYHNPGPDSEAARLLRGTASCVRNQHPNETLLILAERKEAHLEAARKVELLIKRSRQ